MNYLYLLLVSGAFVLIQCLIGGTRLLFSFPSYCILAGAAVISIVSIRRAVTKLPLIPVLSTIVLAGYVIGRAWYSPVTYLARTDAFMAAGCLITYLLTALYLTETRHRFWVIVFLFLIAIGEVAMGVVQFARKDSFMMFGFIRSGDLARASGMFISGNHFAGYLEAIAMFALGITFWSRRNVVTKIITGYLVVVCYFGVAISGSRGGYLSSAFSLLVFAGLSIWVVLLSKQRRFALAIIGITLGLALVMGVSIKLMLRSQEITYRLGLIGTHDVRIYNWMAALDQYKTAPLFGTGSGTHMIYGRFFRRPQIQTDPINAHGDYLELIAEYGAVGGALAFIFIAAHLGSGLVGLKQVVIRRLRGSSGPPLSDSVAIGLGALCAVSALLSHSVVDFNMHIPGNALVFAFVFGILTTPGGERAEEPHAWLSVTTLLRFGLFGLGAATLVSIVPKIKGEQISEDARIALRNKDTAECISLSEEAIKLEPLNFNNYFYLGEAKRSIATEVQVNFIQQNFFEAAIAAYQKGLELFPQDENLLIRLGQALDGMERYDEAEQAYLKAIHWDSNLGAIYAYYGAHLRIMGNEEGANEQYKKGMFLAGENLSEIGAHEAEKDIAAHKKWAIEKARKKTIEYHP